MCYSSGVMAPSCQLTLQTAGSACPCSIRLPDRDTVGGWGGLLLLGPRSALIPMETSQPPAVMWTKVRWYSRS